MKRIFSFILLLAACKTALTQNVGIGTNTPNASAALEIKSSSRGLLIPTMTSTQRNSIVSPFNGLLVYDSTVSRLYQYQSGTWRYLINNDYWVQSTTHNWVYNGTDSIGIGTASPTQRLDVNGNIRTRADILADDNIAASGILSGGTLQTPGNLTVSGNSLLDGDVTANSDIIINNTGATLQLKSSSVNKGFFQISGNDVRFGTNSGNTGGDVTLRMDGGNVINFEKTANGIIQRFYNSNGVSNGVIQTVSSGNRFSITNPSSTGTIELGGQIFINNATGRVGIGNSNPSEQLHVSGSVYIGNGLDVGPTSIHGTAIVSQTLYANGLDVNGISSVDTIYADYSGISSAKANRLAIGTSAGVGSGLLAVGYDVLTNASGACILADETTGFMNNGTQNRMMMRFNNGYRLYTSSDLSTGVFMNNGANSWSAISDSTKKENFLNADGNYFLQKISGMRLGSWNYKTQDKKEFRHYGPMAQEFYAHFGNDGIGKIGSDTAIASADIDGVMMIALQALIREKESLKNNAEKQAVEINALKEKERILLQRVEKIEALISKNATVVTD